MLLNRRTSYDWLNSIKNQGGIHDGCIPCLEAEQQRTIQLSLQARETFQPWTHGLVETISRLPYVRRRFPYQEYVQKVGRLEADGWLVRVYVNHETCD